MADNQTIDINAIVGILLALVFGVIAVVQTYRANKLNRDVAKIQGLLEMPNVEISLFDYQSIENFMIAVPLIKGRVLEMPLRFSINNLGGKSARDVELFIRMSKELCYGGSDNVEMTITSNSTQSKVTREVFNQTDNLETTITKFEKALHPKQGIVLDQSISLRDDTFLRSKLSAPTKDGFMMNISYIAQFAYLIDFVLMQADQKPISKRFSIQVINTSETTVETFFRSRNTEVQAQESKVRFWKSLFQRFFSKHAEYSEYYFKLIQVDKKHIEADSSLPINRVSEKASLSVCDGIRFKDGWYWIPALNIGMKD
jgi:hypothetical protein